MSVYNNKVKNLMEDYKSILFKKRLFYPRKFDLSEDFKNSIKREVKRLKKEGLSDSKIVEKLSKALHFIVKN